MKYIYDVFYSIKSGAGFTKFSREKETVAKVDKNSKIPAQ